MDDNILSNLFNIPQPEYLGSLLGSDAADKLRERANTTGLINMAVGYLAQPKNQRLGLGRILANSYMAGQQGAQGVYTSALEDWQTAQKIKEMQQAQEIKKKQQEFLKNYGQPNATRDIVTQETAQVPVAPQEGAVAPTFETQPQAPTITQERYFNPQVAMNEAISSGVMPFEKAVELLAKQKQGAALLTDQQAMQLGLPVDRGQKYQQNADTGNIDLVGGTLQPEGAGATDIEKLYAYRDRLVAANPKDPKIATVDAAIKKHSEWKGDGGDLSSGDVSSLSPMAIDAAATTYLTTGQLPALGIGKASAQVKKQIMNRAAEIASGQGMSAADVSAGQITGKATVGGINQLQKQATMINAFEKTAKMNADVALKLSAQTGRTNVPIFNEWLQAGQKAVTNNPTLNAFNLANETLVSEYAKIMSGSMGNTAVAASERKHAREMLGTARTPEEYQAIVNTMIIDMGNRKAGLNSQLQESLSTVNPNRTQPNAKSTSKARGGVDQKVWDAMTPQEQALFK